MLISGAAFLIGGWSEQVWGVGGAVSTVSYAIGGGFFAVLLLAAFGALIVTWGKSSKEGFNVPARLLSMPVAVEQRLLKHIPTVPLLFCALVVVSLYLTGMVATAALHLGIAPGSVLIDGSAAIGAAGFLIALPALGYAIRTDAITTKTLDVLEKEKRATRELAKAAVDVSPDDVEASAEPDTVPAPSIRPLAEFSAGGTAYELISPSDVPARVFRDLFSEAESQDGVSVGDVITKLDYVARQPGQDNKPWLFGVSDAEDVWQLSYGGKSKKGPTLKRLDIS